VGGRNELQKIKTFQGLNRRKSWVQNCPANLEQDGFCTRRKGSEERRPEKGLGKKRDKGKVKLGH